MKTENGTEIGGAALITNEDTEMGEGSMAASDDEGGEDGEDGDEGYDDEGSVSAQDSPSRPPHGLSPIPNTLPHMREIPSKDTDMSDIDDLPGPPLPKLEILEGKSGSPLKNVALTTSNLTSPIKSPETAEAPFSEIAPPQEPSAVTADESAALNEVMQQEVVETAPSTIPPPPPQPTMAEVVSAVEERQEEDEEEEMLLDIVENTNNANIGAPEAPIVISQEIPEAPVPQELEAPIPEPQIPEAGNLKPELAAPPAPVEQPAAEEVIEQPVEDEGDFPDLLGGLEKQLDEPHASAVPIPIPEAVDQQFKPEEAAAPEAVVAEPASEEKVEEVKETTEAA